MGSMPRVPKTEKVDGVSDDGFGEEDVKEKDELGTINIRGMLNPPIAGMFLLVLCSPCEGSSHVAPKGH